jgi:hypothetical protein
MYMESHLARIGNPTDRTDALHLTIMANVRSNLSEAAGGDSC